MEFIINRSDLVRELSLAKSAVAAKSTLPILSHVVFVTGDSFVDIYATDLELGIRCQCPATVASGGTCAIPAKRLLDYVRLLPDADVAIKVKIQDNHWASLSCGNSKARIAGLSKDAFPELPEPAGPTAHFPLAALASAIDRTIFAISKEESRFTLTGALFILNGDGFRMVATDGHRMALVDEKATDKWRYDHAVKTIIPMKAMSQLQAMAKDSPDAEVSYSEDENHIFFQIGVRTLLARKMTGTFPDYERVLPQNYPLQVGLDREAFKGALDRVSQFSDEQSRAIRLKVAKGSVTASSSITNCGDSEESVETDYDGPSLEMGFNSGYLLDFLRVADTDRVVLILKDASSMAELRPDLGTYLFVVAPMRI